MPYILIMPNNQYELGGLAPSLPHKSNVDYWADHGFGPKYSLAHFLNQGTTPNPNEARVYYEEKSYKRSNAYSLGGKPVEVEITIK